MFHQCRLSPRLHAEEAESQRSQTRSMNCPILLLFFRKYNIRVEDIMVRDVRYITLNCCYRDLQNVLMAGHLKTLALVESAGETDRDACAAFQKCARGSTHPHCCTLLLSSVAQQSAVGRAARVMINFIFKVENRNTVVPLPLATAWDDGGDIRGCSCGW